jgi:hypothetical protein
MEASVLRLDTTQTIERCEKNSRLYSALKTWMGQSDQWAHLSHLTTCLWMVGLKVLARRVFVKRLA